MEDQREDRVAHGRGGDVEEPVLGETVQVWKNATFEENFGVDVSTMGQDPVIDDVLYRGKGGSTKEVLFPRR